MTDKLCIVFVCQAGELELKGLLLAASLRKYGNLANVDLVAAVPSPDVWGDLSAQTHQALADLSVRKVIIESPFGRDYPIGNKLAAIGVSTQASVTVFMDSDILCLGPLDFNQLKTNGLKAKPADLNTYQGSPKQWERAYSFIGEALPKERVLSTVSKALMLPYFNAGVVAVHDGEAFSETWLSVARQIDTCNEIQHKRPWLDQIALPVAAKSMGYPFEVLTEAFNYPAHLKCINAEKKPVLCHYHSPEVIEQEKMLSKVVHQLSRGVPAIKRLIALYPRWEAVIARAERHKSALSPKRNRLLTLFTPAARQPLSDDVNFLISGLPRSGTSLLCNLLHKVPNTVVINEPQEVFAAIQSDPECHELGLLFRKLRTDILLGKGVSNKVNEAGDVIEDTRLNDVRRRYQPAVTRTDFSLAIKNPLAFLTRLRILCDAHPNMPKIIMVRHPLDVISSWKKSFEHLRDVNFDIIPFTDQSDPLLDGVQHRLLSAIRQEPYTPVKRALYLNYLAELIRRDKERVHVIRYEDLIAKPEATLAFISSIIKSDRMPKTVVASIRRGATAKVYAQEDVIAVNALCGEYMQEWGYQ
ncbi:sulfotransferase family protein [Alteromonas flava]|uniref:sulfotransferase family protein n=1 Tax=Alteromonas flava TaxID=2048003 RepID=UPI000C28E704|nr:sulfotransferase [Alteromonas flava]